MLVLVSNIVLAEVSTNIFGGKPYYHISYAFTKDKIVYIEKIDKDRFYLDGGIFEVRVNKSEFPIDAPNCRSSIILRMPWTEDSVSDYRKKVEKKYEVYKAISDVSSGTSESYKAVIELNPYVKKNSNGFELTECNVFFRHYRGGVVLKEGKLQ